MSGVHVQYHLSPPDGSHTKPEYAYKCFPVRNLCTVKSDEGGAWYTEYKNAYQNPILEEIALQKIALQKRLLEEKEGKRKQKKLKYLHEDFLLQLCSTNDPTDLCVVNLRGKSLHHDNNSDFSSFNNVVTIDASDNRLLFETFKSFPSLRELEIQLNKIAEVQIIYGDFPMLERLDLSYNSLSHKAITSLGKLHKLKDLVLCGCNLSTLPSELTRGYKAAAESDDDSEKAEQKTRFPLLESLDLSENELSDISTFSSLAGLKKLKYLNLSHNCITCVPHLRLMVAHRHFSLSSCGERHQDAVNSIVGEDSSSSNRHVKSQECSRHTSKVEYNSQEGLQSGQDEENDLDLQGSNTQSGSRAGHELLNSHRKLRRIPTTPPTSMRLPSEADFYKGMSIEMELVDEGSRQPFASLQSLDISHNQIADEEGLLALTAWPVLRLLNITENPLTRRHKNTPPVIEHHLQKLCGVHIQRKSSCAHSRRPQVIRETLVPAVRGRKVKDKLPPIRARDIDLELAQLALEDVKREKVTPTPTSNVQQDIDQNDDEESKYQEVLKEDATSIENPVFLTQLDNEVDIEIESVYSCDLDVPTDVASTEKLITKGAGTLRQDEYDILFGGDDEDETEFIPETIHGKVQALEMLLSKPLVFNRPDENRISDADKIKKRLDERQRAKDPLPRVETRYDRAMDTLEYIKNHPNVNKYDLDKVLSMNDKELQEHGLTDAKRLVKQLQKKYRRVCEDSLEPIQQMQNMQAQNEAHNRETLLAKARLGKIGDMYSLSRGGTRHLMPQSRGLQRSSVTPINIEKRTASTLNPL